MSGERDQSERDTLNTMLDRHRAMLVERLDGLDEEQMRRPVGPSQLSLLSLVKHMACVEMGWFQTVFEGSEPEIPATFGDSASTFVIESHGTQELFDLYERACARSREITASSELDAHAAAVAPDTTLRWILNHMIEETAQHNGHADIMRELIDGRTFT